MGRGGATATAAAAAVAATRGLKWSQRRCDCGARRGGDSALYSKGEGVGEGGKGRARARARKGAGERKDAGSRALRFSPRVRSHAHGGAVLCGERPRRSGGAEEVPPGRRWCTACLPAAKENDSIKAQTRELRGPTVTDGLSAQSPFDLPQQEERVERTDRRYKSPAQTEPEGGIPLPAPRGPLGPRQRSRLGPDWSVLSPHLGLLRRAPSLRYRRPSLTERPHLQHDHYRMPSDHSSNGVG